MKKITLLISIVALSVTSVIGQGKPGKTVTPPTRNCGAMNGVSQAELQNLEDFLAPKVAAYLQAHANGESPEVVYTIPTIVHIIHNGGEAVGSGRNIPYARVTEQMQVLNEDFRRTNSDADGTWAQAADCEVNFCLITRYPSGHALAGQALPEVGVDRVDAAAAGFGNAGSGYSTGFIDGTIKPATSWNPNEVMNIWVCQLQSGLLGYAQFPNSGSANTDGTVMQYTAFGFTSGAFGLGRTTTHEVGHWLGLFHISGDDGNGSCAGSDNVADTPNQADQTNSCPSGVRTDGCASSSPGYMYQNYMDYTFDACMNLYTLGQKARVQSTMASSPRRATLNGFSTTLCAPVATASDDAGITSTISPTGTLCSGTITPTVVLRNFGSNALTSVTINYSVDGVPQTPFSWTGSLATNISTNVNLPSISVSAAAHTFDASTSLPNTVADQVPGNDAVSQGSFNVISAGASLPFFEGFEGAYLPTGFTANNNDGVTTWAKTTVAAKSGSASAFMDYFNYSTSKGEEDDIITPAVNLSTGSNPQVSFELAYQLFTDPTDPAPFSDTLEVLISTDCGLTWNSIYRKESTNLTTTTPTFSSISFVPTANQWRKETISLAAYASSPSAMIMFRGIGDYENQMYIDDINIDFSTGIEDNSASTSVNIFPNPATNVINVLFTSVNNTEIVVLNIVGEVIYTNSNVLNRINKIDMSKEAEGVYFVKVKSGDQITTKKIILVK